MRTKWPHREWCEFQATADEVQRSLRIFSQRFCPTDFYETDLTPERRTAGLNFQKLPLDGATPSSSRIPVGLSLSAVPCPSSRIVPSRFTERIKP